MEESPMNDESAGRSLSARYFNAFRIASYLLVFYALGHTLGAVTGTPHFGAESDAVIALMKSIHVRAQGADCSWWGFYRGFGAVISVQFVLAAVLTWHLGGMTAHERHRVAPVAWALLASSAAGAVIAWVYFFPAPIAFATAITLVLGVACVRDLRAAGEAARFERPKGEHP
jgi:hypothetical protein